VEISDIVLETANPSELPEIPIQLFMAGSGFYLPGRPFGNFLFLVADSNL
jgi:hypothetical protein